MLKDVPELEIINSARNNTFDYDKIIFVQLTVMFSLHSYLAVHNAVASSEVSYCNYENSLRVISHQ
jgi:hypothetical protein